MAEGPYRTIHQPRRQRSLKLRQQSQDLCSMLPNHLVERMRPLGVSLSSFPSSRARTSRSRMHRSGVVGVHGVLHTPCEARGMHAPTRPISTLFPPEGCGVEKWEVAFVGPCSRPGEQDVESQGLASRGARHPKFSISGSGVSREAKGTGARGCRAAGYCTC